mgnify:CR=1 FL=1
MAHVSHRHRIRSAHNPLGAPVLLERLCGELKRDGMAGAAAQPGLAVRDPPALHHTAPAPARSQDHVEPAAAAALTMTDTTVYSRHLTVAT